MKLLILALIRILITLAITLEVDEEYAVQIWPKYRGVTPNREPEATHNLGIDLESGCACKQAPKMFTLCFGIDNCLRFPKNLRTNEDVFKLRTTSVGEMRKGDLDNFKHLRYLEIVANYNLTTIEGGTFQGMVNLRNLSICFNVNLQYLDEETFLGLVNLRELFLVKNGFSDIENLAYSFSPNYLPKLTKLKLHENNFKEIGKNDLKPMNGSLLEELGIMLCQITYIHPEALLPFKKLSILRLGENTFEESVIVDLLNATIRQNIPLRKLNLLGVGFRMKPPDRVMQVLAKSNITRLSLAYNQFEELDGNSFYPMKNLVQLDLRHILAFKITKETFQGMPNLRTILLSGNKIPTIPEGVLLPQLHYLDLSSNSGDIFYPSYFTLGKNKFVNMSELWGLNLSFNNIHVLHNYSFQGLSNLKQLSLKNATLYHINNGTFLPLKELLFLDLENNPFPKTNPFTNEIFKGLRNLRVLLLGGCSITHLDYNSNPFEELASLKYLGLERNNLKVLSPKIIMPLKMLKRLNIAQNFLTSWHERMFTNNQLKQLIASQNKIIYVTKAMISDFSNLSALDLSKNPLSCDCYFVEVAKLSMHKNTNITLLDLISEQPTYCVFPDDFANVTLIEYYNIVKDNKDLCSYLYSNSVLTYSLSFLGFCVFFLPFLIFTYKYRWYIRYYLFLTRISVIRRGKVIQKNTLLKDYKYDAFVSYCNEDRNFVAKLVSVLENNEPYLKLCVYERDFEIGTFITESVFDSIAKSRKILLVVSNSYLQSHWCRWEAQVVEHNRLFFQDEYGKLVNDSIVIIKLEKLSKVHMTRMLKYLLKTRIYLEWDSDVNKEKVFWEKLRKTLAPPEDFD